MGQFGTEFQCAVVYNLDLKLDGVVPVSFMHIFFSPGLCLDSEFGQLSKDSLRYVTISISVSQVMPARSGCFLEKFQLPH